MNRREFNETFAIQPFLGDIELKKSLDYEKRSFYHLKVSASVRFPVLPLLSFLLFFLPPPSHSSHFYSFFFLSTRLMPPPGQWRSQVSGPQLSLQPYRDPVWRGTSRPVHHRGGCTGHAPCVWETPQYVLRARKSRCGERREIILINNKPII